MHVITAAPNLIAKEGITHSFSDFVTFIAIIAARKSAKHRNIPAVAHVTTIVEILTITTIVNVKTVPAILIIIEIITAAIFILSALEIFVRIFLGKFLETMLHLLKAFRGQEVDRFKLFFVLFWRTFLIKKIILLVAEVNRAKTILAADTVF